MESGVGTPLHLFEAFGVELEYMIVDSGTLDVRPVADEMLKRLAGLPGAAVEEEDGGQPSQVSLGAISVSNELVLHVAEFKTTEPARTLAGLAGEFQAAIGRVNGVLGAMGCRLMSTGMHPWMEPNAETKLWPHGFSEIYGTFNKIFDCRGHGWSNLQATHLNLPFADDEEFGRLHAAIRILLPIMPALSASTPYQEGRATGLADTRMEAYRNNSNSVPEVRGLVVPEPAYTRAEYDAMVFEPLYKAISPKDPEGVLQHEWLNARGAIARFMRNAIEIRVLDVQEYAGADVGICALIAGAVRLFAEEKGVSRKTLRGFETKRLSDVLLGVIREADEYAVRDVEYLKALGVSGDAGMKTLDVWRDLAARVRAAGWLSAEHAAAVSPILERGCLSRRLLARGGKMPTREMLKSAYAAAAGCLAEGRALN